MVNDVSGLFLPILHLMMVLPRMGTLWMFFPVFGQANIPARIRMAGALTLSLALTPLVIGSLPAWTLSHLPSTSDAIFFVSKELVIGAGMGLVARWMFAACVASAHWLGSQMGFSVGGILNPEFQQSDTAWSEFNQWLGIMIFLSIGGHWLLIQALRDSYRVDLGNVFIRLGDMKASSQFWIVVGQSFFVWMLKLSGPMVVVILLLQCALGVLSRFVPQINIWFVSIPLTLGVGVFVFSLLSPMYGDALQGLFAAGHETNYLWIKFLGTR